jgi:hypothetical protein
MRGGRTSSTPGPGTLDDGRLTDAPGSGSPAVGGRNGAGASPGVESSAVAGGVATTDVDDAGTGADESGSSGADVAAGAARWRTWAGRALVLTSVVVSTVTLIATDRATTLGQLKLTWQLIDLRDLTTDPLGSVWYLHTQPPGYNLLVGIVGWLGAPLAGTVFAIFVACLLGTGLLLHGLLVRWGVGPIVAGAIVAFALLNPSLLTTMTIGSYEVPVALLAVASLVAIQRYLDAPSLRWLLATSGLLTLCAMTRSLFNPIWLALVLVVVLLARPVSWRRVGGALLIPLVLVGGWMLKNQILFGTPTMSSWLGFNMQRGIVAPMDRDLVAADVRDGQVSDLALEYPWLALHDYDEWTDGCEPVHDNAAVSREMKQPFHGLPVPNYNNECFLPAYAQAQEDAATLARRHPGRYAHDRLAALAMSYRFAEIGSPTEDTWLDNVYEPLLGKRRVVLDISDWNLSLLTADRAPMPLDISLTLAALTVFVLVRGGLVSLYRLARRGWRGRHSWPAQEVVWLVVAWTTAVVILGGDLIEFGENGRFRSTLDPLLVALPLAALAQWAARARARRRPANAPTPSQPR